MTLPNRFLFIFTWLLAAAPLLGQGYLIRPDQPKRFQPTALELRSLNVEVTINQQLATTKIEHRFFNPGSRWKEATFYYTLPRHAKISQFDMIINGRRTKAELLDAKKAARIYQDIVRNMRDPALLEAIGSDVLKARVFPIEARSEKVITLEYQQLLESDDGIFAYQLPLQRKHAHTTARTQLVLQVDVTTQSPTKTLWSPSHSLDISKTSPIHTKASFESDRAKGLRPFELFFSQGKDFLGMDAMTHTDQHGNYVLLNLTPRIPDTKKIAPKDLILIVDTSGSMAGEKLEQVKAALNHCLVQLRPEDRFSLIRFATDAEAFSEDFQQANKAAKKAAKSFIDNFEALGGTHIQAAFDLVGQLPKAEDRPQVVIFLTDGKPTIGERDNDRLVTSIHNLKARFFPVGIGAEVNTHLLDRIAEFSKGRRTYVNPEEDLEFKVSRLFNQIQAPVLTDVKLSIDGVRLSQRTPQQLPDLYQGNTLTVMGRYRGHGKATIHLEGKMGGKLQKYRFTHRFPKTKGDYAFIPQLWAKRRVGYLLDQIRLHGESQEMKEEVVQLATRYGLITPYTSYLILEDEETRPNRPDLAEADHMPIIQPRPSRQKARRGFEDMQKQTGEGSVEASRSLQVMANEMVIPSEAEPKKEDGRRPQPSVSVRNGRAFYLVEGEWRDSLLKKKSPQTIIDIEFGSPKYFSLLESYPDLKNIYALGEKILFLHLDKTYRIKHR